MAEFLSIVLAVGALVLQAFILVGGIIALTTVLDENHNKPVWCWIAIFVWIVLILSAGSFAMMRFAAWLGLE